MFNWIRRILRMKAVGSGMIEQEAQQRERLNAVLRENPDASNMMKMLAKDFEARSLKHDKEGSASSPVSSP